jgi:hypothetical protein
LPFSVIVAPHNIVHSSSCLDLKLVGYLDKLNGEYFFNCVLPDALSDFLYERPAKKFAREKNIGILVVIINLFSDEACGNISKATIIFENLLFSLANLPFKTRCKTENSYVISSSNGVKAMEQIRAVINDLKSLEEGILGVYGLSG